MRIPWALIQIVLFVLWWTPWLATAPAWVIFLPTIIAALVIGITLLFIAGAFAVGFVVAMVKDRKPGSSR